jgi:hypothetical protein
MEIFRGYRARAKGIFVIESLKDKDVGSASPDIFLVQSRSELDKLGYRCDGHIRRHRLHIDLNRHNSASQGQQSNVRGVDLPGCTVSVWPAPGRQARTRKQEMP